MAKDITTTGAAIFICSLIGVLIAMVVEKLYGDGIITIAMIAPLAINQLMFLIVLAWIFVGIVVGVSV